MTRVLVAEKIGASGIQLLRDSGFDVDEGSEHLADIASYDGLLIRSATTVDAAMLDQASNLKAIGRAGVGVDNVDVPSATSTLVIRGPPRRSRCTR